MPVNANVTIVNPDHRITVTLNGVPVTAARELPVRVFGPDTPGQYPVIVYSHGHFGGPTSGTGLQAEALAALGYIVIAPRHPDSLEYGAAISQQFPLANPASTLHRVADVQFALDQAGFLATALGPGYSVDLSRAVMAGHSHGAYVAGLIGGLDPDWAALDPLPGNSYGLAALADPRFRAIITLSPQGLTSTWAQLGPNAWAQINRPVLTITSDADETPGVPDGEDSRLDLFRRTLSPTALALFDGASHNELGGFGASPDLTAQVTSVMDIFIRAALSPNPAQALETFSGLVYTYDLLLGAFDGPSGSGLLVGDEGASTFTLLQTDDAVFGGGGLDTAQIAAASASAQFWRAGLGAWEVTAPGQGTDYLDGVERVRFTDRTLALRPADGSTTGDGTSDIVLWNAQTGIIHILPSDPGFAVGSRIVVGAADLTYQATHAGDFDGDGRFDLLFRNAAGVVVQWALKGAGIPPPVGVYRSDPAWSLAGVGDVNADGKDDLVWRNAAGVVAVWAMNGLSVAATGVLGASDPAWSIAGLADFDGDGADEILWRQTATGTLAVWETAGLTSAGAAVVALSDPSWAIVGTGDFNGDLREDILWRSSGGVLALWTMDGTAVTSVGAFAVSDAAWSVSDIGDYNGDGRDDILWQGPDGTLAVWTMNGFAVSSVGLIGNPGAGWFDIA